MTIKTTIFTHRPPVSFARSSFCWWRHNFTAIFTTGRVRKNNTQQGPFHEQFSIAIEIRRTICLSLKPLLDIISLQHFAHTTTTQCAVVSLQNFTVIDISQLGWEQNEISIEFELRWRDLSWNEPLYREHILSDMPYLENCLQYYENKISIINQM